MQLPLPESTLIDAIMQGRSQVDFLWQFFVTVHIAIFALLFIYDEAVDALSIAARAFAVVGIAAFDAINGRALTNAYKLVDAMHVQYRALYGEATRFEPAFYEQFVQASFSNRPDTVLVTHSTAFLIVLMALVSRSFIRRRAAPGKSL